MPRYEIRDTSDDSLTYVEGDLPLNLMLSQAAGTYRAKVMSAEEATDIVVPTLTASIAEASLDVGDTATLTTNAPTGSTYQWELDGTPISGATSATYVTASEGSLTCVIDAGPQSVETAGVTVAAASSGTVFSSDFTTDPGTTLNGVTILSDETEPMTLRAAQAATIVAGSTGAWEPEAGNSGYASPLLKFKLPNPTTKTYTVDLIAEWQNTAGLVAAGNCRLRWTDDAGVQVGTDIAASGIGSSAGYYEMFDTSTDATLASTLSAMTPPSGATCFALFFDDVRFLRANAYIHDLTITEDA